MDRLARAFISMLLLAAVGLGAGCGYNTINSGGKFDAEKFWKEQERDSPAAAA